MPEDQAVLKAVVIDDYYARPNSGELRRYINTLRQFITDNLDSGTKQWFDQEFGLSGDHRQADYFDLLLAQEDQVRRFWGKRDDSPVGTRLSDEVFSDLVQELRPAHASLKNIETYLAHSGWEIRTLSAIPGRIDDLAADVSLIAIDYILVPGDPAAGLRISTDFLKSYLERARGSPNFACPFVLLISENPQAENSASSFRASIDLHGPYFRFAKKADLSESAFGQIVTSFQGQREELESYRKLHDELQSAALSAAGKLAKGIKELELQDLATLHAGQLVQEGEPLSDYLAWLFGQYFMAEMVQHKKLANQVAALPTESYKVLLGHLRATQNIPKLFAKLSFAMPASALRQKSKHGKLQLRFGDLFVYETTVATGAEEAAGQELVQVKATLAPAPAAPDRPGALAIEAEMPAAAAQPVSRAEPGTEAVPAAPVVEATAVASADGAMPATSSQYLMVISQTCDLFHQNITNGQVLCVDGKAHPIRSTEVDLLRATIRQMDLQGRILLQEGANYVEIEWRSKDLRTVDENKLTTEDGYRYLGRLNEMYALQAQHSALLELGRIGVPVPPSYSVFFGKTTLTVLNGAREIPNLGATLDQRMVVAVLRNEKAKKSKHRLLISEDLRMWLIQELARIGADQNVADQLKGHLDQFRIGLDQRRNWSLIVKVQKDNIATFAQERLSANGEVEPGEPENLNKVISIILKDMFDTPAPNNQHIQIAFERI